MYFRCCGYHYYEGNFNHFEQVAAGPETGRSSPQNHLKKANSGWPLAHRTVAVGDRRLHPKVNWVWHYLSNNVVCQVCGKHERNYPNYICDAHTHGMNLYGHPEFQVVIDYGAQELGRLLIRR